MFRFIRTTSLGMILTLGLLHGLLYIFLVPPWQHSDEPTHFEYAWLIANRPGLPLRGEFDQPMRREVAASMLKYNFFRGMDLLPDLDARNEEVWIGISQVGDPPLYYLLASLPLRFFSGWDVTRQLYAVRFVSLGLYLMSIVIAWKMMKELVSEGHILRWMVPLSMSLLPGYTDLMTSVNNDVGAILLFCLFLWGSLRLIRHGFTPPLLLWVSVAALLCLWTKETVILALPLLGLVLLLAFFRDRWRWVPWVALAVLMSIILMSVFSWGDALFWIRSSNIPHEKTTRARSGQAPLGNHVIQIENIPNQPQDPIFQLLSADQNDALKEKTVTLGAWVWASKPITIYPFVLYDGRNSHLQWFQIDETPTFVAITATLPEDAYRTRMVLSPSTEDDQGDWTVFYDGLVMVEGARPLDEIPQFSDSSAKQGLWGGIAFQNLLRNASAESSGPGIRSWAKELISGRFQSMPYPSLVLGALIDWSAAGWYYQLTAQNLLNTFWAKFGWGHVPLIPLTDQFYLFLNMITLIGLGGVGVKLLRLRNSLPWNVLLFLGIALTGIWAQTFLRGIQSLVNTYFIPSARYIYPVIIPFILALNIGWLEVSYFQERWVHFPPRAKFWAYALFFLILDIASLSTIFSYYYIR